MKFSAIFWYCLAGCILLLVPARGYSDFIVTNMFAEVGVSAGNNSDGAGGHDINEAFLSISDGLEGTSDYQFAEASFGLFVEDDTDLADYTLTYDSQTMALTEGTGTATALSNGIIVFSLTEDFNVTSLLGESSITNSLGEPIDFQQDITQLLTAGTYSLSFGSSAFVFDGDTVLTDVSSDSGLLTFNSASVPEPATVPVLLALFGIFTRRSRNV